MAENGRRDRTQPEYELADTGVFDEDRFFDVEIEYAKAGPEDIVIRVTATNRGPDPATLHLLPTLWYRNTWSWGRDDARPLISRGGGALPPGHPARLASPDGRLPPRHRGRGAAAVHGQRDQLRAPVRCPERRALRQGRLPCRDRGRAGRRREPGRDRDEGGGAPGRDDRSGRAPRPSGCVSPASLPADPFARRGPGARGADSPRPTPSTPRSRRGPRRRRGARRSGAPSPACIWTKQVYRYDVAEWLDGDPAVRRPRSVRRHGRNAAWRELNAADVLSMPDGWEYPWFAAWDLAFHMLPMAVVDPGLRQGPAAAPDPRVVHAPQRPAAGLRVGVRRRQPAGPRLGRVARVQDRPPDHRAPRSRLPRPRVPQAAAQLHVVGQPQGPRGEQRLRGRLPGPRQHRRLRPLRGAARSRATSARPTARPGWASTRSTCWRSRSSSPARSRSTRTSRPSSSSTSCTSPRRSMAWGRTASPLWDPGDEFFYDVLHLESGEFIPLKVRSVVGHDAAAGGGDPGAGPARASPGVPTPARLVPEEPAGARGAGPVLDGARRRPAAAARARPRPSDEGPAAADAGSGRVPLGPWHPLDQCRPSRHAVRPLAGWFGARRGLRARRVADRDLRRQLQLARSRLVAHQLPAHRGAPEVRPLLRGRLPGAAAHRFGPAGVDRRGCRRALADGSRRCSRATPTGAGRSADPTPARSPRGRRTTSSCSTSTSTATRARASAPATRPAGRRWLPSSWSSGRGGGWRGRCDRRRGGRRARDRPDSPMTGLAIGRRPHPAPVSSPSGPGIATALEPALRREWLVANGLGGYASGRSRASRPASTTVCSPPRSGHRSIAGSWWAGSWNG